MLHCPRNRGGGVGLLDTMGLNIKLQHTEAFGSFEYVENLMKCQSSWICIIVLYRLPPSHENKLTERQFLDEFTIFLEYQILLPGELLSLNDFNFHTDDNHDLFNKIKTHSKQRITNDIKELFIANYTEKCVIENWYICNKN